MSKIKILADTACDLDIEYAQKYGIEIVPIYVTIEGTTYRDRYDIAPPEFYEMIAKPDIVPVTAQVPPALLMKKFKELVDEDYINQLVLLQKVLTLKRFMLLILKLHQWDMDLLYLRLQRWPTRVQQ